MKTIIDMPHGAGPCAKQIVAVLIVGASGNRYLSTNYTLNPQQSCPRADLPTGVGYELCKSVCNQPAHAEVNALRIAGPDAKGGRMLIAGHTYACNNCTFAAQAAGLSNIEFTGDKV